MSKWRCLAVQQRKVALAQRRMTSETQYEAFGQPRYIGLRRRSTQRSCYIRQPFNPANTFTRFNDCQSGMTELAPEKRVPCCAFQLKRGGSRACSFPKHVNPGCCTRDRPKSCHDATSKYIPYIRIMYIMLNLGHSRASRSITCPDTSTGLNLQRPQPLPDGSNFDQPVGATMARCSRKSKSHRRMPLVARCR
ncbi:hypothetical protein PSP20601_01318 [Pandoraea sputorum]|uniref:Uncharacterized protein n=1 Tax=Pandoraea sputorum TaxID=93222 RepID=A0A239SIZ1_9BURK|nr:Uncharacterised protein [Pandoraea sputorum]VVD85106.1 hypothetical protein PSP20601_01318 [Pandoraea sputorum]